MVTLERRPAGISRFCLSSSTVAKYFRTTPLTAAEAISDSDGGDVVVLVGDGEAVGRVGTGSPLELAHAAMATAIRNAVATRPPRRVTFMVRVPVVRREWVHGGPFRRPVGGPTLRASPPLRHYLPSESNRCSRFIPFTRCRAPSEHRCTAAPVLYVLPSLSGIHVLQIEGGSVPRDCG